MKIRFATFRDKQAVLSLFTQLGIIINQKLGLKDPKNEHAEIYGAQNYDRVMHASTTKIFVIEDHHTILGAASFFILTDMISGERFAHIDDFIIETSQRKKGYGKALLTGILTYAKKHAIHTVKLTSSLPFTDAHKFYEKMGGTFTQKVIKFDIA